MCRWTSAALCLLVFTAPVSADYPGVGLSATPAEIKAWDTDIGPDLDNLPNGRGSVAGGKAIYTSRCAGCHGPKGRSTAFFYPLVGGTRPEDIKQGRVAGLREDRPEGHSTLMLLPTLTTLLDYTYRAMPFDAAGSLTLDEVYAVSAYVLFLGGVVQDDFVLDAASAREAQASLPNRSGFTTAHGLWPGAPAAAGGLGNGGTPDTQGSRCMAHCLPAPADTSPDNGK